MEEVDEDVLLLPVHKPPNEQYRLPESEVQVFSGDLHVTMTLRRTVAALFGGTAWSWTS